MTRLMVYDGTESSPKRASDLECQWISSTLTPTVTVITSIPTTVASGANWTMSGTVKTSAGVAVPSGTVNCQYYSGSAWVTQGTATVSATGTWSRTTMTQTSSSISWRAVFVTGGTYNGSTSATKTVSLNTPTTYVKTYACTGTASYQGGGAKRSGIVELYQGYYSTTNDNQRSVAAFADATIRADLVGATITKVELYLNALHWGDSGGGTAVIGTISTSGVPASNPSTADYNRTQVAWSSKTGAKWCVLTNAIGNDFKSGAAKSILIGPGPSTSTLAYYGYFAGNGQTGEPQLRITYTK